jgi:hypothetical protein
MTEDIHGEENPVWQKLKLNQLDSTKFHFKDLGKLVSSVHVYPMLLVIEKRDNQGAAAMTRQLGIRSQADVPTETRTAISLLGGGSEPTTSNRADFDLKAVPLKDVFPSVSFKDSPRIHNGDFSNMVYNMPSKSCLFVRDGDSDLSMDSAWDDKTDKFMHKILRNFKWMHEVKYYDWDANMMQQSVESLHFYPHLAIVKRTGDTPPLVKASMHGTTWIPYVEHPEADIDCHGSKLCEERQAAQTANAVQVARETINAEASGENQ